jgi:hypothetical protein
MPDIGRQSTPFLSSDIWRIGHHKIDPTHKAPVESIEEIALPPLDAGAVTSGHRQRPDEESVPITRLSGQWCLRNRATAPEPVHISTTNRGAGRVRTNSAARNSVSGRGIKTLSSTARVNGPKATVPSKY